jgi:hypothetical protein
MRLGSRIRQVDVKRLGVRFNHQSGGRTIKTKLEQPSFYEVFTLSRPGAQKSDDKSFHSI